MTENVTVAEETNANPAAVEKRTDGADLDALLAEFDQGTNKETAASQPEPKTDNLSALRDQIVSQLKSEQQTEKAVNDLVKSIRGEVPEDLMSNDEIQDWLEGQAKRSVPLRNAWLQRDKNPGEWKKIEAVLSNKLNGKFGKPRIDPEATADKEAVAQAVRGASTRVTAEPPPDFSRMSNAEFERWKMENMK